MKNTLFPYSFTVKGKNCSKAPYFRPPMDQSTFEKCFIITSVAKVTPFSLGFSIVNLAMFKHRRISRDIVDVTSSRVYRRQWFSLWKTDGKRQQLTASLVAQLPINWYSCKTSNHEGYLLIISTDV